MGSFCVRQYLTEHSYDVYGAIIMGTGWIPAPVANMGKFLADCECKKHGNRYKSRTLVKISIGNNNKPFEPARTPVDWLSRDFNNVDKYVADSLCGFDFTAGAYRDFFAILQKIARNKNLLGIRKLLPILVISGEEDPVGGKEACKKFVSQCLVNGLGNTSLKLLPYDRHEILNEIGKDIVYEFYILEITTGLRLGEILALTWDDLDIKNKTISVNKQVQRIKSELKITTPKTTSSIRTVALCDECFNQLILLRSRQRLDTKLIFPSPITGGLRDPSSVTRKLHRMQKRAGVPQIRFHDLRHSFATLSLEQGMDIKTVSHMLGHTDAGFTMNTYMHVTDNMQQTVADAMGNLIAETENKRKNKLIHFSA